ncbi:MAG: hypothetical protein QOE40_1146 [Actinomycetota bacterium]|nr:hypothetical protein [Actinomycetota bacterium]
MTTQDHRELVAALLAVEGVAGASVEPTGAGPGTLRLQLTAGTDEVRVAGAVNRMLRARFGLAVDADRVRVLDEPGPLPPVPTESTTETQPPTDQPEHAIAHAHPGHEHPTPVPDATAAAQQPAADRPATTADRLSNGSPGRKVVSDAEGGPARVESSLPEPGGAVVTGSGGAFAQKGPVSLPEGHAPRPNRLAIERVEVVSAGLGVAVTVSLALEGRSIQGAAEGAATQSGVYRSVAVATLRAVESVVDGQARFSVEHVELAGSGADRTVLVVLEMVTGRSTQRLSGSSVVREDVRQAVIRAVLAAVNRRMEPMLVSS